MNRVNAARFGLSLLVAAATWLVSSSAGAQITQPGAHQRYNVELDPHVLWQHSELQVGDGAWGFGLRASIPFVHNGPVTSINNSIGISFGLDFGFFGDDAVCRAWGAEFYVEECSAMNIWFPITAQWNFYFSRIVSVFAEPGLAFQYESLSLSGTCADNLPCSQESNDVDPVQPTFWLGGRFLFADRFGVTIRVGYPSMTLGGSILL